MVLARAARWRDAPAIAAIHLHVWQTMYKGIVPDAVIDRLDEQIFENHWRELLQRRAPRDLCIAVDDDDGKLCAFAHLIVPPGTSTAELVRVLVAATEIGGEAFFLLNDEAERELVRRGYRDIETWVSTAHTIARSALEALGWHRDGGSRVGEQFGVVVLEVCYRRALPTEPPPERAVSVEG